MEYVDNFNENTISCGLKTKWAGKTVHFSEEIDSTNEWLKRLAPDGEPEGSLAVADIQTAGKGRRGRRWSAPAGSSIAMSLLLRPDFSPEYASMMTPLMGMAVAKCCADFGLPVGIKWPNDVIVDGKKICGILTEMQLKGIEIDYVIIGTGINVNLKGFPEELTNTATSFYLAGEKYLTGNGEAMDEDKAEPYWLDRTSILCRTLKYFEGYYEKYLQTRDLSLVKEEFESMLLNKDQVVRVLDPKGEYTAIARGITNRGELIVELSDGSRQEISTGEVSVRGVYGYV